MGLYSNEEQTGTTWRGRKWPIILFIFPCQKSQQKTRETNKIILFIFPRDKSQQKTKRLNTTITLTISSSSIFFHCFPQKSPKNKKVEYNNNIDNIVIINIFSLFSTKGPK